MSAWRREASDRLPELQPLIASRDVDNPMMLWIELNFAFGKACDLNPLPVDQLRRYWHYCEWCLEHGSDDVTTAAVLGFCEHLIDTDARVAVLPLIMARAQFQQLREVLLYHNDEARYSAALECFSGS